MREPTLGMLFFVPILNPVAFFRQFAMDVLQISFTASNTVRDDTPYTIYEIEIRSSSTITWVIYKRYSDFHKIHEEVPPRVSVLGGCGGGGGGGGCVGG
jgi:hypothetical protein